MLFHRGMNKAVRHSLTTLLLLLMAVGAHADDSLKFVVSFAPNVSKTPFTGRVLVFFGKGEEEPREGPNWFDPQPIYALDVKDWKPDTDLTLGTNAIGFPVPINRVKPGAYKVQAVLDLHPISHEIGDLPGNAYSRV